MQVCLGETPQGPALLELRDNLVLLNGESVPIKNLTEAELADFQKEIDNLPAGDPRAQEALANSVRAAFLARLLGKASGDECVSKIQEILDHVHYAVLQYLDD